MVEAEEDRVNPEGDAHLESSETEEIVVSPDEGEELQESDVTEQPKGGVPVSEHVKLRKKKQEAEEQLESMRQELEEAQRKRDLALLAVDPKTEKAEILPPNPDDYFGDPEGYTTAFNEWNKLNTQQIVSQVQSLQDERLTAQQQAEQQAKAEREAESAQKAFYEKADALAVDDFLEAESVVKKAWSPWFYQSVIQRPDAEKLIYALGKDPDPNKALELALAYDKDPVNGIETLLDYATKHSQIETGSDALPEPDTPIEGGAGGGGSSYADQLEKLRVQKEKGAITMNELIEKKRALKSKYAA